MIFFFIANAFSDTGLLDLILALGTLPELSVLYLHGLTINVDDISYASNQLMS